MAGAVRPWRRRVTLLAAGLAMAAAGAIGALVVGEIVLRIAGVEYHLMPAVQFGWPDPQTIKTNYADDPDLFWVTKDYRDKLRSARHAHPAVVFMGDSCTEFGEYPARTLERLAADGAPLSTGIHLAAGGWTSEQGRAQLTRDVLPLHPRIIVVYFGWNDHWIALGPTDAQLRRAHRWLWLSEHSRIIQAGLKAWMGLAARATPHPSRVPPERYLENLRAIVRAARDAGITTVLVTAPSNHVAGREPAYLLRRHVNALSDVVPLHEAYVSLTRTAAKEPGAVLCDAFVAFAARPDKDLLFRNDGIHFTAQGDVELGRIVAGCIERAVLPAH